MPAIFNVVFPFLVAVIIGLTLPGTSIGAEWLGPGVVKVAGVALLLLVHRRFIDLFSRRDYTRFVLVLFVFILYRTLHNSVLDTHWMLPWVSLIWLLIIVSGMRSRIRIFWLSLFLLIPLFFTIFSPGIDRILNLSRGLGHNQARESLTGLAYSYNIYAMSALAGYFIALTSFLATRKLLLRVLLGTLAVIAFLATATAGSRGGMVTIITGSFFNLIMFQFIRKKRQNLTVILSVYLVVMVLIFLVPWENIFFAITSEDIYTGSTAKRWFLYTKSLEMGLEQPLIGWGWEAVRLRYFNTTHSGWLQIFAELGLLGLALEVAVWVMLIRFSMATHRQAYRSGDTETMIFNLGYLSLFLSYGLWQMVENISFAHGSRLHYLVAATLFALYLNNCQVRPGRAGRKKAAVPGAAIKGRAQNPLDGKPIRKTLKSFQ